MRVSHGRNFLWNSSNSNHFQSIFADLKQEGIFRKTGSVTRQQDLKFLVNHMKTINLDEFTCHDVASVMKSILADLPEPLLTEVWKKHCRALICFLGVALSQLLLLLLNLAYAVWLTFTCFSDIFSGLLATRRHLQLQGKQRRDAN